MYIENGWTPTTSVSITNSIIWNNAVGYRNYVSRRNITMDSGSPGELYMSYTNIEDGLTPIIPSARVTDGGGNIDQDPCFVHSFLWTEPTIADGGPNTVRIGWTHGDFPEPCDIIEYCNDGVARRVIDWGTYPDWIITFTPDLPNGESTKANRFFYYWGPGVTNVDEDLHLREDSPCVDAGDPCTTSDDTDIDLEPRIIDSQRSGCPVIDMGIDEMSYPFCWDCATQCHGDANCDGRTDNNDWPPFRNGQGTSYPDADYIENACADFNRDGAIDDDDFDIFAAYYLTNPNADCAIGADWPPSVE